MEYDETGIASLVQHENWPKVEAVFVDQILSLNSIGDIEAGGDPIGLQTEIRARQLAASKIKEALRLLKEYAQPQPKDSSFSRIDV